MIGIALGFAFGQQLLLQTPFLAELLPWALVAPLGQGDVSDASALMLDQPMPYPLAVPVAVVASIAFVVIAIRASTAPSSRPEAPTHNGPEGSGATGPATARRWPVRRAFPWQR